MHIQDQAKLHKRISFADELKKFLVVHGIRELIQPSLRDVDVSSHRFTQHCVLGYFQPVPSGLVPIHFHELVSYSASASPSQGRSEIANLRHGPSFSRPVRQAQGSPRRASSMLTLLHSTPWISRLVVILQPQVRNQRLTLDMPQRVLQLHQLNKEIMFRIKPGSRHRRLPVKAQPLLNPNVL